MVGFQFVEISCCGNHVKIINLTLVIKVSDQISLKQNTQKSSHK